MEEDDFLFEEENRLPEDPFYVEVDVYDSGDFNRLLVVPCNSRYVVVFNDEHLCTLEHTCDEPDCWELIDGNIEEELVEKVGAAIKSYSF